MNQPQLHVGRGAPEPTALSEFYDVRPPTADRPPSLRTHWPRDTIARQRADLIGHLTARDLAKRLAYLLTECTKA